MDIKTLNYNPRPPFIPMHQRDKRFASLVCHRRAGKSYSAVHECLIRALYTPKHDARYAYIAPFRQQAREIAWVYLKQAARPFVKSEKDIRESELRVRLFNGHWITLYGSDNVDALRGIYLDGVIIDEMGTCRPNLWHQVILPTLADRRGWAIIAGTPAGKNAFYQLNELAKESDEWFQLTLKASESGLIPEDELALMREVMTDDQYQQEMECSFTAAVLGTFYASIIEQLELKVQTKRQDLWDRDQPVQVACDLGYTDSTAFWFWQTRPDGIAVIDYYENHSQPLAHYIDYLHALPYNIENLFVPHDAKAKTLQTGKSTIEQLLEAELPCRMTPNLKLQHGIDAARLVLPHCWFDQRTDEGIECLRAYRRRYDDVAKAFSKQPVHDWSSHGADAFRYMALVAKESLNIPSEEEPEELLPFKPPPITLDQLWADNERQNSKYRYEKLRI